MTIFLRKPVLIQSCVAQSFPLTAHSAVLNVLVADVTPRTRVLRIQQTKDYGDIVPDSNKQTSFPFDLMFRSAQENAKQMCKFSIIYLSF